MVPFPDKVSPIEDELLFNEIMGAPTVGQKNQMVPDVNWVARYMSGFPGGSIGSILDYEGSSSFVMRRKTL